MKGLMKIAVRNVFAHKVKTMIVGTLIFMGILILVFGNSFLDSSSKGIQNAYSKSITADIAVLKNIDFDYSLFGTWNNMGNLSVPVIPDFDNTLEFLESHEQVKAVTALSSAFLMVNTGESNPDFWINSLALDPDSYTKVFDIKDTLIIHEGRFLEQGEEGIIISTYVADYLKEYKGLEVHPGDKLLLNGYSANGFRIREVPIRGIFEYNYVKGDMYPMLPRTCFMDQQNFNLLNGIIIRDEAAEEDPLLEELLFTDSMENLFVDTLSEAVEVNPVETDLSLLLGDLSVRHEMSQKENGDWQWLLVSLNNSSDRAMKDLRNDLEIHFQEDFSRFESQDFLRPLVIAEDILYGEKAHSLYLNQFLSELDRENLELFLLKDDREGAGEVLVHFFNNILQTKDFYQVKPFEDIYFSSITQNLTESRQKGYELIRMNRLILEELYPYSINKGPDYMVSEWWHAASPMSSTVMGIQWVLNLALVIIFIVAIIIIMNTLIISVMERTGEIGTIRAMGGQKSFVFSLFTMETMTISLLFGTLGIAAGALVISVLGSLGIPVTDGSVLQMITGSDILYPSLSTWTIGLSFLFIVVVGSLSSLYPLWFALKIKPVEAMRQD